MTFWNWLKGTDDYQTGYDAGWEFIDLVDHDLSDNEANAQWDCVESGHTEDYITGYADAVEDRATPWWKIW
jgi:hypothetical protein